MPSECILDAHSLIWFIEGNSKLGTHAQQLLADPTVRLIVPAIALAEACRVTERGRTTIPSVAALQHQYTQSAVLLTADARIRTSGLVRTLW